MESKLHNYNESRDLKEVGITIFGQNLNPNLLSIDFLKLTGIIPNEWNLVKQPVVSPQGIQLNFDNNLMILAQPGSVTFVDTVGKTEPRNLKGPQTASNYVEKLPNGEYDHVNIGAKIIVPCTESQDAARRYLAETLMAMGPWQKIGKAQVQVSLNLFYELDNSYLNMSINEASLQEPNKPPISAIIFSGAFTHNLIESKPLSRLNEIKYHINNWSSDWEAFKDIIYNRFLISFDGQAETVFHSPKLK